jgi:hypothetical protein
MSTYMELLRSHRSKKRAASVSSSEHRSTSPLEETLLPDLEGAPEPPLSANPLAEAVSDLTRIALQQVGDEASTTTTRDASTYIDMMRTNQGRTGFSSPVMPEAPLPSEMPESPSLPDTSEAPTLAEEPLSQILEAMMQDERPETHDDTGSPAERLEVELADETADEAADQPLPPLNLTESNGTTTRDASTYIDMMRTIHGRTGFPGPASEPEAPLPSEMPESPSLSDTSEMPTLAEEMLPQAPETMLQDERPETHDDTGSPAERLEMELTDEAVDIDTDQPHPPLNLTESNDATSPAAWLSDCVALLLRIYEAASHNVPSDLSPLLAHLKEFTASVYEDNERLNTLELEISNHIDEFRNRNITFGDLLEKAVMMMLYGIKLCMHLRMEPPEITRHVTAAMLHNIGMALTGGQYRLKEGTLSDAERALIRRTPGKSLEYLKECGVTDPLLLQAAEQAQERFDGSGPQGLAGTDIALSARITSLLSMFEALVHFRKYRERLLPSDAIRELVNRYKSQFDPEILKVLIESVSLYPIGTYVQLNSGDVGQVIRIQPRLPMRPRVLLTLDRHGNKIQPREVDLREQPNLMVQRCMYAAGLASLKQLEEKA